MTYPIIKGNQHFDIKLYTGNGGGTNTQTISGLGFSPDLVWIKSRSAAIQSNIFDTVRGSTKGLISSSTSDEITDAQSLTSFNNDGFTLGSSTISLAPNYPSETYVSWNWNAGSSTVTNTSGSISSQVRANTTAGFSVVTWTGAGSTGTVGHGLGVAPKFIIAKRRNSSTNWQVYSSALGATNQVCLNLTNASFSTTTWNNTSPTSSVFSVDNVELGASGGTYVAYCFSEVKGFSKFGSYTGNGNADGAFVYTGFRPAYVMYKRTDSTGGWNILDDTRNPSNAVGEYINANLSDAEANATIMDILSNGFKMRNTFSSANASGGSYIYMAFAETPFKYASAR
jgi:hypothetical protein